MTSELRATLEELTAVLRAPLSAEAPAGEDTVFDTSFERARAELEKLSSVNADQPDWALVASLCDGLLRSKTKDLRLAVWGLIAKTWNTGTQGLAEGLVVLHGLASSLWDTVHPLKRARARANLYGWLCEQLNSAIEPLDVGRADLAALETATEVFDELDAVFKDKLGDIYPGPGRVRGLLRTKLQAIPPPTPPPPSVQPVQEEVAPAEASPPSAPSAALALVTADDAREALRLTAETQAKACVLLQATEPQNPASYRARRLAARILLGERVEVAAPLDGAVSRIEALVASGDYLTAVSEGEAALDISPLSLDIYRAEISALEALGHPFLAVRAAVEREVSAILATDPAAVERRFEDGAPAADPATRAWAENLRRRGASADHLLREHDHEVSARLQWAHGMLMDGRGAEAMALAIGLARRSPDGRARYLGLLEIARAAVAANQAPLAVPILGDLRADVERHQLDEWEPRICIPLYAVLLSCTRAGLLSSEASEADLYARLYRLDPVAAVLQGRK